MLLWLVLAAGTSVGQVLRLHVLDQNEEMAPMPREFTLEELGFASSKEGIRNCLKSLTWSADDEAVLQASLVDLDSDDYWVRGRAVNRLIALPLIPRDRLEAKNLESPISLDKRQHVLTVLEKNTPARFELILFLAAEKITSQRYPGLVSELLAAASLTDIRQRPVWDAVQRATLLTAGITDLELLRSGLEMEGAAARAAAMAGIAKVAPDSSVGMIRPLLDDPDDRVRFHAAMRMRELESAECLPVFISLLERDSVSPDWDAFIQSTSVQALRRMTGQAFLYRLRLSPSRRNLIVKKWWAWLEKKSANDALSFECRMNADIKPIDEEAEALIPMVSHGAVIYARPPKMTFSESGFLVATPKGDDGKPSLLDNPNPIKLSYDLNEMREAGLVPDDRAAILSSQDAFTFP